jgi:fatty acid desaturase
MADARGDARLIRLVRADLPPEAFRRRPWRALLVVPLVALIVATSAAIAAAPPWYAAAALSLLLGNLYASLFFFGHEVAHGAVVRSRRVQDALLYPAFAIVCLSPHFWRIWHHSAHHAHTNEPGVDPDNFGTLEEYRARPYGRFILKFSPGSGHWLSALNLFTFFTLHAQNTLWLRSRGPAFRRLRRGRAVLDSALMLAFWIALGVRLGPAGALWVIVIPMLLVNAITMSYIETNHQLRPLDGELDTLATTMSVRTLRVLDLVHFHFSHHVEHHLFPTLSGRWAPLVRESLMRHAPGRYLAPSHWRALRMLFSTPRLYDGPDVLADPVSGRRVRVADVEAALSRP